MHEDSIVWTAFTCPLGHFEWLVMPFGLKNAPIIFQQKMDSIFHQFKSFVSVYLDDVLVHSKDRHEHTSHLKQVLNAFDRHGVVISTKKAQFFRTNIEFLGVELGNGRIKLQQHISQKVLAFPKISTIKELQKFLGLINYARPFLKDIGKLMGPLYSKLGMTGLKQFNDEDYRQIEKIKAMVKVLPELKLPLDTDYIIIETDGCENGWGAILKRKLYKYAPKNEEQISRYASGQFREKNLTSSIDQEILAILYGLDNFRLFIINKKEITLRTDCEAIVKFYHNKNSKKISQRRWLQFSDRLINRNYKVQIEHIKGKDNDASDILSRLLR